MLPPDYLLTVADSVVEIYAEAEQEILEDIARRIVKNNHLTETAKWQIEKAKEIGMLQGNITKIMASASKKSSKEISRIMKEAGEKGLALDDAIYKKAGLSPLPIDQSPALLAIVLQGRDATLGLIGNYTKTTAKVATNAYNNALDKAFLKIVSGAQSPTTAIKDAINEIASLGMEKVAYPSGGFTSLEASVRKAVTTGVNQAVAKLQIERASELGTDLVEVTSHSGARPSHASWQGGIYSIKGQVNGYRSLADACGYGSGDGLCGWNCYHSFFPYFEGLSSKGFSRDPAKDAGRNNEEEYDKQQKQRYYERLIRTSRKEVRTINTAIISSQDQKLSYELKEEFERASAKLKNREKLLKKYLEENGLTAIPENAYVAGWNKSLSMKAYWASKRKNS